MEKHPIWAAFSFISYKSNCQSTDLIFEMAFKLDLKKNGCVFKQLRADD